MGNRILAFLCSICINIVPLRDRKLHKGKKQKNDFSVITLEREIQIVGLSHKKNGIKMSELWDHMGEIEDGAKHLAVLSVIYGLWIDPHPNEDYLIGVEVTSLEGQTNRFSTFTIPKGRYIQNVFNAENVNNLLGEKIKHKHKEMEEWAEANQTKINWDVTIEVYPDGMFEMEPPEMFYLCHID